MGAIERKYHSLIRKMIALHLAHAPDHETRDRKPLLREVEFDATWELRFGPNNRFRVFYRVDLDRGKVEILAVGVKEGSRLSIGGQEIEI